MELFKLLGTIAIDNSDANESIGETTEKASNFGEKLKSGITTVAKWGTAITTTAVAASGAMIKFASSSASTADNIDKMSQKIGISREAYQELDFICSQSGTSVDNLQAGMKSLVSAMDGAASGTESNIEQFKALGIAVTDADGNLRSSEEVMWETMEALQGLDNQTEKARLATELFGRSGTELMPLLNGASGSIEEMKNQAKELGLVLDDETIDSGVKMTDTIDQLKRSFSSIVTKLGGSLMPIVQKVAEYIIKAMPKIQDMFNKLEPIVTMLFDSVLPPLMDLCEQIMPMLIDLIEMLMPFIVQVVEAVLPILVELLQTLLPPLMEIIEMIMPILMELLEALIPILEPILELLQPILDLVIAILGPLMELLDAILPPIIAVITEVVEILSAVLKPVIEGLTTIIETIADTITNTGEAFSKAWDGIKEVWEGAGEFFSGIWEGIQKAFGAVADWFGGIFTDAWEAVKNVFSVGGEIFEGIKDGILSALKEVINALIKGINTVISIPFEGINAALKKIKGISIVGMKPFDWIKTFDIPEIPLLAKGGVIDEATPAVVGEDGAEAVMPLEKNTGWIDNLAAQINAKGDNSQIANKIDELIKLIKSLKIYLDSGVLVGALTPAIDAQLGQIYVGKERGR